MTQNECSAFNTWLGANLERAKDEAIIGDGLAALKDTEYTDRIHMSYQVDNNAVVSGRRPTGCSLSTMSTYNGARQAVRVYWKTLPDDGTNNDNFWDSWRVCKIAPGRVQGRRVNLRRKNNTNSLYPPRRSKVNVLKSKNYTEDKIKEKMLQDSVTKFLNHKNN
jgi:hypothetical protein